MLKFSVTISSCLRIANSLQQAIEVPRLKRGDTSRFPISFFNEASGATRPPPGAASPIPLNQCAATISMLETHKKALFPGN